MEGPFFASPSISRSPQSSPQRSMVDAAEMVMELHYELPNLQGEILPTILQVPQLNERDQTESSTQKEHQGGGN